MKKTHMIIFKYFMCKLLLIQRNIIVVISLFVSNDSPNISIKKQKMVVVLKTSINIRVTILTRYYLHNDTCISSI